MNKHYHLHKKDPLNYRDHTKDLTITLSIGKQHVRTMLTSDLLNTATDQSWLVSTEVLFRFHELMKKVTEQGDASMINQIPVKTDPLIPEHKHCNTCSKIIPLDTTLPYCKNCHRKKFSMQRGYEQ